MPDLLAIGKRKPFEPTLQVDFILLGFLDEYAGRRIFKNGDEIEWFYPTEVRAADRFESYLVKLIEEKNLVTTIERKTLDGRIHFYSQEITSLLNSFYGQNFEYERSIGSLDSNEVKRYSISELSYSAFKPITSARFNADEFDSRFSYLFGVYQRYGKENIIELANATQKAELVNRLFQEIRCDYVTWTLRQDCVPFYNKIEFALTEELKKLLA